MSSSPPRRGRLRTHVGLQTVYPQLIPASTTSGRLTRIVRPARLSDDPQPQTLTTASSSRPHRIALRALLAAGALVLTLGVAGPAAGAATCGKKVIDDWYDNGRVDGSYPLHCYDDAIDALPRDVRDYSSAKDDIERALQARMNGQGAPPATSDPTPGPARPSPGTIPDPTSPVRRRAGPAPTGRPSQVTKAACRRPARATSTRPPRAPCRCPCSSWQGSRSCSSRPARWAISPAACRRAGCLRPRRAQLEGSPREVRRRPSVRYHSPYRFTEFAGISLRTISRVRPTLSLACAIRSADRQVAGEEIFNSRDGSGGRDGHRQAGQG